MTKSEAHLLLDAARAGAPVSAEIIDQALSATGDLGGEAPVRIWRGVDEWASIGSRGLAPPGIFDGLMQ